MQIDRLIICRTHLQYKLYFASGPLRSKNIFCELENSHTFIFIFVTNLKYLSKGTVIIYQPWRGGGRRNLFIYFFFGGGGHEMKLGPVGGSKYYCILCWGSQN